LPENPVKKSDTRSAAYIEKHGNGCWEIDALEPRILENIVRDGIMKYFDESIRKTNLIEMAAHKDEIRGKYRELLDKMNDMDI
jgi:hypothetical protein